MISFLISFIKMIEIELIQNLLPRFEMGIFFKLQSISLVLEV